MMTCVIRVLFEYFDKNDFFGTLRYFDGLHWCT